MKKGHEQWQVDDELLTETGRGGLFTDGYLQGDPLISYLGTSETPLFVFGSGKRGVRRERAGETERFVPASGYRAITAVTDRRVQFVVGGGDSEGDWAASIHLADIDRVVTDEGLIRDQLTISADGTDWRVYLRDVNTDRLVTFLEEVSWAWIQVEELLDDARKRLVDAGQHQKSRSYESAHASLSDAKRLLREAHETSNGLAPDARTGIEERIGQVKSRFRETKRRVHASKATHLVDEAESHWRSDEYERAYEVFVDARTEYETVLSIDGLDSEKGEAMKDRIDKIDQNLDALAAAPLKKAHRERAQALDAEDAETALDRWLSTLDAYRRVLELDWGRDDKRFEGDVDQVRDRIAEAVESTLDVRRELATKCRLRGDEALDDYDVTAAREAYSDGITHLEEAVALAREFDPAAVVDLEARLDELGDRISDVTHSVASDDTYDDFDNWVTLDSGADDASSSDDELADVDRLIDVSYPTESAQTGPEQVVASIERLQARPLLEIVETVWDSLGWRTELLEEDDTLIAHQEDPSPARLVVTATAQPVGPATIENCADLGQETGADRTVVVSASEPTETGRHRAEQLDVNLLDPSGFAALLDREDLTDLVSDIHA